MLVLASFLRLLNINETMPFIGDQGWFYLSARDMIINHQIPVVGIASSHTWLHQGALWTYILAFILWVFKFNPIAPAFFTASVGVLTVYLIYNICSKIFSERVGIISSVLYSVSPLIIAHDRMPYHTSLIPLFTLLLFNFVYKWTCGNIKYFPFIFLMLSLLYNLELSTIVLWFIVGSIILFGFFKKKKYAVLIAKDKKTIIISLVLFLAPMTPIFIHDFNNGFPQTVKFAMWLGYRMLLFFGYPSIHDTQQKSFYEMLSFLSFSNQKLVFSSNLLFSLVVFVSNFIFLIIKTLKEFRKDGLKNGYVLISFFLFPLLLSIFLFRVNSDAYLPALFPFLIITYSLIFDFLIKKYSLAFILFLMFIAVNINSVISYLYSDSKFSFKNRLEIAKKIVKESNKQKYNLVGKGEGSQFSSFTMNYEYLTWRLGNEPSKKPQNLIFIISEDNKGIHIKHPVLQ